MSLLTQFQLSCQKKTSLDTERERERGREGEREINIEN